MIRFLFAVTFAMMLMLGMYAQSMLRALNNHQNTIHEYVKQL